MIDKEKFRKEVEKLKSNLIHGACSSQVAMETHCKEEAYNEVLAILDTMQEESVSKKLSNVQRTVKNWKEPVSEELEEEIEKYMNALYRNWTEDERSKDSDVEELCKQTARYFTNWQKQKDSIVSEELIDVAKQYVKEHVIGIDKVTFSIATDMFISGAKWQKKRDYIPLSDDINEIARQICNKVLNCEIDYKEGDVVLSDEEECVKAGIRWQMQKESIPSKDLELTYDDICEIMEIREDVLEMDSYENLYEEILKRFKNMKDGSKG